jgi:hypothetical protein
VLNDYINQFKLGLSEEHYLSQLTGSGYPLELSFTSRSEQPRYTIDPFCHSLPPHRRLQATIDLIKRDFQIDIDETRLAHLKELQACKPDYGAWLGLREKHGRVSPKLYVEVDTISEKKHWPQFCGLQPFDRRLTMVGYTPDLDNQEQGSYELYYRSLNMNHYIFPALLSPINASKHADKLQIAVEKIYGRKLEDRWPGGSAGFSYAVDSTGQIHTLTLYAFCRSFFGRDMRTRLAFEALIESSQISAHNYLELTEHSQTNLSANTQHGMLAITISSEGEIVYGVGYCPVYRPSRSLANDC